MRIAIVDDLQCEINKLVALIERYANENNMEHTCCEFMDGETFLKELFENGFDVVFLDIFLKDESGIDVAQKMRDAGSECLIIFSTATDQYAVKGFRLRAFDYLVKPYDYSRMSEVLSLCAKTLVKDDRYFTVKSKRQNVRIMYRDVIYVDYYNHYVQIHTKTGIISTYSSFDEFYCNICGQERFLLCCRNCAINMDEVGEIFPKSFTMTSGDVIAMSKKQEKEARSRYADYAFAKLEKSI
ncbi:MAG: LytTR family DNA-binding domain-containing protein [Oscillospiraceae bacterium]